MRRGFTLRWYRPTIPLETFFLGTHRASWLRKTEVPLFVSRRQLECRKTLPRARGPWALDSGGFTELSLFGRWTITAEEYVAQVRHFAEEIGSLRLAAPMDHMCEPWIVARTGLTVEEHQRRTLENYLELRSRAPELPWMPVLQGWKVEDYLAHAAAYRRAGVDLAGLPAVGVGSVCRRQSAAGVRVLLARLQDVGARYHVFGMKTSGLRLSAGYVTSADSLSWSLAARWRPPLPGCEHRRCNNCLRYALRWRRVLLRSLGLEEPAGGEASAQLSLL